MKNGSQALWESSVQANCTGDLALIDFSTEDHTATSLQIGPNYYLGTPGAVPGFQNMINNHPFKALAVLLGLLLLLCLMILRLLRKRRQKRVNATNA